MTLLVHIVAGGFVLVLGAIALSATKGGPLHRRSGILFVYAMLTMAIAGVMMAPLRGVAPAVNIPAGLLTAYLVITALTTLRPRSAGSRLVDLGAMLVAFAVGLTSLAFGLEALAVKRNWMTAFPFLLFGVVGLLAAASDLRLLRSDGLGGAARLARHLWRMCFALFIAATAFFLGQPGAFPKALRSPALLGLPVLMVLVILLYWLWRVRIKGGYRAVIGIPEPRSRTGTFTPAASESTSR
jgi:uncharacterized membrane protein